MCAVRGREILENAAALTAPGGRLLFSTCTFSLEENEQNVDAFLTAHPDFSLTPVTPEIAKITANGVNFEGCAHDMTLCRRFYPHLSPGEGQFVALLQRSANAEFISPRADNATLPSKKDAQTVQEFLTQTLKNLPRCRLVQLRDNIYLAPDIPLPPRGIYAAGVCIGTLQKGRLVPHHQLFSAYGADFQGTLSLSRDDARVAAYLRGEEIDADGVGGICAVIFEGAPLGGGKLVGSKVKNYYPK
jgi:NOL1/NOP2/fmu family ribosome biogenesis protein